MFGLAMIAAVAAMAFIGASSASATVLCETTPTGTNPAICHTGWDIGANAIIKGTAVNPELTSNLADVVCAHSETEAEITNTGGASSTVTGTIKTLKFTQCKTTVTNVPCNVTVENLPYHAEVHWITGTHDGTLTVKEHNGKGAPGATVTCASVIECTFDSDLFDLDIDGGNPAVVTAEEVPLTNNGGAICPSTAKWDATYKAVGTTTAIWVAKEMD